ncbi:MAG: right-handed parallel beta-helix repeat-containing protein [Cyanobacteria bacterium J06635_1]
MAIITVQKAADSGQGSLREAIASAQAGDTIKFHSSLANKTIGLTSGDIDIPKDLIIDGAGAANLTLSGNNKSRIFEIGKFKTVTIKNLNFANGREVIAGDKVGQGGAIKVKDYGTLVVENSNFRNNVAERGGAIQIGYSGRGTVRNSTFDRNDGSVSDDGFSAGAIATYGSGVGDTKGFLIVEGSTFTNNKGKNGGGVYVLLGPLTIKDSVFKNNTAKTGGAVFTDGGQIKIRNTQVNGNTSKGPGGGLFLWNYGSEILIEDSLINGNTSTDNSGGGMRVGPDGKFILRNSTVANNSALQQGGGVWVDSKKGVTIEGSTFSGNAVTKDVGGGIFMKTPDGTPVKISHSTFVDHASGRDAETIWVNKRNSQDVTLTNTVFAGQGSVNFVMRDGGGNYAENSIGGRRITDKATYLEDLKLSNLRRVGDQLVHVPQAGSPLIKSGRDAGAYDVGSGSAPPPNQPAAPAPAGPKPPAPAPSGPKVDNRAQIQGTNANDKITGGGRHQLITAKAGNDQVWGGAGNDRIKGEQGHDRLFGQDGNDLIWGGRGKDHLRGGRGRDRIHGNDHVDRLWGEAGDDSLYGDAGNDFLEGGKGRDRLYGGYGSDFLNGGDGRDHLVGIAAQGSPPGRNEQDVLVGGKDGDTFVLGDKAKIYYRDGRSNTLGLKDYALIRDFNAAQGDKIQLHGQAQDYWLGAAPGGVPRGKGIFLKTAGQDELIAVVQNNNNLKLQSNAFKFV